MYVLSALTLQDFLVEVTDKEFAKKTTPKINNRSSNPTHSNIAVPHSNYNYSTGAHANTPHSNGVGSHYNGSGGHNDYSSPGSPSHSNTPASHYNSAHNDKVYNSSGGHTNGWGHSQAYSAYSYHNNNAGYNQSLSGHSNVSYSGGGHTNNGGGHNNSPGTHSNSQGHNNSYSTPKHSNTNSSHSNATGHSDVGFDHTNYVPSRPYLFNSELIAGRACRDTSMFTLVAYDRNLQEGLPTTGAVSRDIYFSVELRKKSSFDGSSVTADEGTFRPVSGFAVTPVSNSGLTASALPLQKADASGRISFTINTRNPFGKPVSDWKAAEGVYEFRLIAWNQAQSQRGVTEYFISQIQFEEVSFRQNYEVEVAVTNEREIRDFVFSRLGAKTTTPEYKAWVKSFYGSEYAQNVVESGQLDADASGNLLFAPNSDYVDVADGIFLEFTLKDEDKAETTLQNWQKATAYLKRPDGTVIAQAYADISRTSSKGTNIVSSEGETHKGYVYFGSWLLPEGENLSNAYVELVVKDYLNATCTLEAGSATTKMVNLSIDTVVPAVSNKSSVIGVNVGAYTRQNMMYLQFDVTDEHPGTKFNYVKYAISKDTAVAPLEDTWTDVSVGTDFRSGLILTGAITDNGAYYLHIKCQDFAGNETSATYGPFYRRWEGNLEEMVDEETGMESVCVLVDRHGAGKVDKKSIAVFDGADYEHRLGYVYTVRTRVSNATGARLELLASSDANSRVAYNLVKYRVYSDDAAPSAWTDYGHEIGVTNENFLVQLNNDDTEASYIVEWVVYVHRDSTAFGVGDDAIGKGVGINLVLENRHIDLDNVYPPGHPLAGQVMGGEVTVEKVFSSVFKIVGRSLVDGGMGGTN